MLYFNESSLEIAKLSETGDVEIWNTKGLYPQFSFFTNDIGNITFCGASSTSLTEIYYGKPTTKGWDLARVTSINDEFSNWNFGTVESIRWKSKDGTEIEGVLRKPSDFDPGKKYPLLFLVHEGPT